MWQYNYTPNPEDLVHYGVLGMKWGVHRSLFKSRSTDRLQKKALKYDLKSERLTKKSEKAHSEYDLGRSNKSAKKAAGYRIRATKMEKKALKANNDWQKLKYEKKAAKLNYKASSKQIDANRQSKSAGYGVRAMQYSIKSDKVAKKAAKIRLKLANNAKYIEMTKRKLSSVQNDPKLQQSVSEIRKKYNGVFD